MGIEVPQPHPTFCVLLAADRAAPPEAGPLPAVDGWEVACAADAYVAMATLCLRQRSQAARSGWGVASPERLALAVANPPDAPTLADLLQAVRRHVPRAAVYLADGQGWRTLVEGAPEDRPAAAAAPDADRPARAETSSRHEAASAAPSAPETTSPPAATSDRGPRPPRPAHQPNLRLVHTAPAAAPDRGRDAAPDEADEADAAAPAADARDDPERTSLSAEEIDMLLAAWGEDDDASDDAPHRRGAQP